MRRFAARILAFALLESNHCRLTGHGRRLLFKMASLIVQLWQRCTAKPGAAVVALALCVLPARADDCTDVGALGTMLGQLDRQCPDYRLTRAGRDTMVEMAMRASALANGSDRCVRLGKASMLSTLSSPKLDDAARSSDPAAFKAALCQAIAIHLHALSTAGGLPAMYELRRR